MNTPRAAALVLLLAGMMLALGSVGQARHPRAVHAITSDRAIALNPAVAAEMAQGRAAGALQFAPGATNLHRLGL